MKKIQLYIKILLLAIVANACSKSEEVRKQIEPISLMTRAAGSVTAEAIIMHGQILSLNQEKIVDAGFMLYEISQGKGQPIEVSIGAANLKLGDVSVTYRPTEKLKPLSQYEYCIFVKTEKSLYKGEPVFLHVDDFDIVETGVELAALGDTIYVEGEFDRVQSEITVHAGNFLLPWVKSADGKKLTIVLPQQGYVHGQQYDVEMRYAMDNRSIRRRLLRSIKVVASVETPSKYAYGLFEPITFVGRGISEGYNVDMYILIGERRFLYHQQFSLSMLEVIPKEGLRWGYYNGRDSVFFSKPLLLQPLSEGIGYFEHSRIHKGELATFLGLNLQNHFNNKVDGYQLDGHSVNIKYPSNTHLYASTDNVPDGSYSFVVRSPYYIFRSSAKLEISSLHVQSRDMGSVVYDDVLVFRGNFIAGHAYNIQFDQGQVHPYFSTAQKDGELRFPVPSMALGNYAVKVGYNLDWDGGMLYQPAGEVSVVKGEIQDMIPRSGYLGDIITLRGRGLSQVKHLTINGHWVYPMHRENGDVQFFVPGYVGQGHVSVIADYEHYTIEVPYTLEIK